MNKQADGSSRSVEKTQYIFGLAALTLTAAFLIVIKLFPAVRALIFSWKCPFYTLTGLYCPGCGGTRAVLLLLKGRLIESFLMHPIVLNGAALYVWFMASHTLSFLTKGAVSGLRWRNIYLWAGLIIIAANWLLKNILILSGAGL